MELIMNNTDYSPEEIAQRKSEVEEEHNVANLEYSGKDRSFNKTPKDIKKKKNRAKAKLAKKARKSA